MLDGTARIDDTLTQHAQQGSKVELTAVREERVAGPEVQDARGRRHVPALVEPQCLLRAPSKGPPASSPGGPRAKVLPRRRQRLGSPGLAASLMTVHGASVLCKAGTPAVDSSVTAVSGVIQKPRAND